MNTEVIEKQFKTLLAKGTAKKIIKDLVDLAYGFVVNSTEFKRSKLAENKKFDLLNSTLEKILIELKKLNEKNISENLKD